MMSNPYHYSAIDLNNKASCLLDKGDLKGAVTTLSQAFHASKLTLSANLDTNQQITTGMDRTMIYSAQQQHYRDDDSDKENFEEYNEGFLYRRAICIPSSLPVDFESSIVITCSIIFNLALTYQVMATMGHENTPILLKQAATMYEKALTLQMRIKSSSLFTMATVNNLAFVHQALNNSAGCKRCLQHLLILLLHIVQSGQEKAIDLECYFWNATHLVFSQNKAAAAA